MDNFNSSDMNSNNMEIISSENQSDFSALNNELLTIPFSILTAEAHNILFQWLEKQAVSHFSRDNFSINKIYKKYYGAMVFWFTIKPELLTTYNSLIQSKQKEIIVIPGSQGVPSEVITLAHNYDFMKLTDMEPKNLSVTDYIPIQISEKEAEDKALARLKKLHPNLFDDNGKLKKGVELEASFPMALPFWEGTYQNRHGKEHKFYIDGQKGDIAGETYTESSPAKELLEKLPIKLPLKKLPIDSRYFIIGGVAAIAILCIILLGKTVPDKDQTPSRPSPVPSITTPQLSKSDKAINQTQPGGSVSPSISPTPTPSESPSAEGTDTALAAKTVEDNFKFINDKKYHDILDLRTEAIKAQNNAATYETRYSDNIRIRTDKITVESCDEHQAQVIAAYTSVDSRNSGEQTSKGEMRFFLIKEKGRWLINDSQTLYESIVTDDSAADEEQLSQ